VSEIVLIRHGETEWSRSMQHTGTTDLPLLPEGETQAREIAARLAGREFAAVLSSPMQRALRTAELAGFGDRVVVDEDLRERNYGEYEGRTTKDIRKERPGWDVWRDDLPGGETLEQLAARADRVIERLLAVDGDALVFAHSHFLRELGARWIGLGPDGGGKLVLGTSAISVLGWERERRVLKRWNLTGPLH
jgi:broad specificity phosphatase PhoE